MGDRATATEMTIALATCRKELLCLQLVRDAAISEGLHRRRNPVHHDASDKFIW